MCGTTHSRPREVVERRNQWSQPVVGRAGHRPRSRSCATLVCRSSSVLRRRWLLPLAMQLRRLRARRRTWRTRVPRSLQRCRTVKAQEEPLRRRRAPWLSRGRRLRCKHVMRQPPPLVRPEPSCEVAVPEALTSSNMGCSAAGAKAATSAPQRHRKPRSQGGARRGRYPAWTLVQVWALSAGAAAAAVGSSVQVQLLPLVPPCSTR